MKKIVKKNIIYVNFVFSQEAFYSLPRWYVAEEYLNSKKGHFLVEGFNSTLIDINLGVSISSFEEFWQTNHGQVESLLKEYSDQYELEMNIRYFLNTTLVSR